MDTNNSIKAVIGITILILITSVVVIPMLSGIDYTVVEKSNEPTRFATSNVVNGTYTYTSTGFEVNGTNVTVANGEWIALSDSVAMIRWTNASLFQIFDYGSSQRVASSTVTISNGTWTAGTNSGSLGNNAIIRWTSGELGVYGAEEFKINKNADSIFSWASAPISVGGQNYDVRALISGPIDDLTVRGAAIGGTFVDGDDVTASIQPSYIEELNPKTYVISPSPRFDVTLEIAETETTASTAYNVAIAAPITYLETDENVQSIAGLAPLIIILGVITSTIALMIIRRQ